VHTHRTRIPHTPRYLPKGLIGRCGVHERFRSRRVTSHLPPERKVPQGAVGAMVQRMPPPELGLGGTRLGGTGRLGPEDVGGPVPVVGGGGGGSHARLPLPRVHAARPLDDNSIQPSRSPLLVGGRSVAAREEHFSPEARRQRGLPAIHAGTLPRDGSYAESVEDAFPERPAHLYWEDDSDLSTPPLLSPSIHKHKSNKVWDTSGELSGEIYGHSGSVDTPPSGGGGDAHTPHAAALIHGPIPAHLMANEEEMFPLAPPSTGGGGSTLWEAMSEGSSPRHVVGQRQPMWEAAPGAPGTSTEWDEHGSDLVSTPDRPGDVPWETYEEGGQPGWRHDRGGHQVGRYPARKAGAEGYDDEAESRGADVHDAKLIAGPIPAHLIANEEEMFPMGDGTVTDLDSAESSPEQLMRYGGGDDYARGTPPALTLPGINARGTGYGGGGAVVASSSTQRGGGGGGGRDDGHVTASARVHSQLAASFAGSALRRQSERAEDASTAAISPVRGSARGVTGSASGAEAAVAAADMRGGGGGGGGGVAPRIRAPPRWKSRPPDGALEGLGGIGGGAVEGVGGMGTSGVLSSMDAVEPSQESRAAGARTTRASAPKKALPRRRTDAPALSNPVGLLTVTRYAQQ
jgi:hypothetical protein